MNRKIIYVDFIFKKKRITSKPLLFIYKFKINIKNIFNNIFVIKSQIKVKSNHKNSSFKKVL